MAKERNLVAILFRNIINSLRPRQFTGKLIGEDYFGTKYYEIPINPSSARSRPSRYFEPKEKDNFEQEIPAEWESWLRFRRKEPPSVEEVLNNAAIAEMKKKNAAELEAKMAPGRPLDPLPKAVKGRESFPVYDEYELAPGHKKK